MIQSLPAFLNSRLKIKGTTIMSYRFIKSNKNSFYPVTEIEIEAVEKPLI